MIRSSTTSLLQPLATPLQGPQLPRPSSILQQVIHLSSEATQGLVCMSPIRLTGTHLKPSVSEMV